MSSFLRQLKPALLAVVTMTLLCGVAYPLLTTGVSQLVFHDAANGSLVERDGEVVGSELLGQPFTGPQYFHGRPSAAGGGYDGAASSGSNLGPSSADLLAVVEQRVEDYRAENGLAARATVPVDAVTASASGLDPDISIANARLQAVRVARVRGLDMATVMAAIDHHTDERDLMVLGEPGVNVLTLNLALDAMS